MSPRRLSSVLLWSVITGAFIGPGTVVTAASAGARHGLDLLWAVAFSTAACLLLQEAAARLTIATGHDLATTIGRAATTTGGRAVAALVLGAVVLGCAAYEAGNILGAVAGALQLVGLPGWALTLAVGAVAAGLLSLGRPSAVARALGLLVALMGIAFLATAVALGPDPGALLGGLLLPRMPAGSTAVVIAVVGTTVVPYNLFLGSSLARDGDLRTARFGMAVAIGFGGLMTAAIVVAGAAVAGELSFGALAAVLSERLGAWAGVLFGLGLLGAGLSSAVTAPLAAALTVQGVAGVERAPTSSWRFRAVWIGVLATGLGFGLAEVRPIPAILLAQALNGVMLPLAAVILVVAVNDRSRVGEAHLPGRWHVAALGLAATVTVVLGVSAVIRAVAAAVGAAPPSAAVVLAGACALAVLALAPVARRVTRGRAG